MNQSIRDHWKIENLLHRALDVAFNEEQDCKRAVHAAKNFSTIRRVALNILNDKSTHLSMKSKRLRAAWETDYLEDVLQLKI